MRQYEVIIPVRNGGEALQNCIRSILSCANAHKILLTLSDNFSTDGSPWKEMLKDFPQEAWRIISPPQSLGRVEHWGWAFAQARLPWIKPLMVGDCVENEFWDWVGNAIEQFPQAGIFFSGSHTIDPSSAHAQPKGNATADHARTRLYEYEEFTRDTMHCINRIGALSQALLREDVMRTALPFEAEFPWTADVRFCKRCLQRAPAVENGAPLVCLDRSITRLSTSWKGIRSSFREEWRFSAEQAAVLKKPWSRAFAIRCKAIGTKMIFVIGKRILPRSVRGFLTSATGLHRPCQKHV